MTPKTILAPVYLAGTTVTQATLHNQDFIAERDIRIGDTVSIRKAGEIVPEVLSVELSKRPLNTVPFKLPSNCPECGAAVEQEQSGAENSSRLCCTSSSCPAQLLRSIAHFASRDAMDIDGLGPAIVENLVTAGLIKDLADLYYLDVESVASLKKMGKKSAEKLIQNLENSKSNDLANLLYSFGIRQVGRSVSKLLAIQYASLEAISNAPAEQLLMLDDIGEITVRNLKNWLELESSKSILKKLSDADVNMKTQKKKTSDELAGKVFVLTGTLEKCSRAEASELIESNGGKVSSSVSKKTSFVVSGTAAGSKLKKAQDLGLVILLEADFLSMVSG